MPPTTYAHLAPAVAQWKCVVKALARVIRTREATKGVKVMMTHAKQIANDVAKTIPNGEHGSTAITTRMKWSRHSR
jgi:hypothetical protein